LAAKHQKAQAGCAAQAREYLLAMRLDAPRHAREAAQADDANIDAI
jgi:hypothetical protein